MPGRFPSSSWPLDVGSDGCDARDIPQAAAASTEANTSACCSAVGDKEASKGDEGGAASPARPADSVLADSFSIGSGMEPRGRGWRLAIGGKSRPALVLHFQQHAHPLFFAKDLRRTAMEEVEVPLLTVNLSMILGHQGPLQPPPPWSLELQYLQAASIDQVLQAPRVSGSDRCR